MAKHPCKSLGSPVHLSQGRRLRSTLPSTVNQLRPHPVTVNVSDALEGKGERAKHFYDKTALPQDLPQLQPGENVRMRTSSGWVPAKVTQKCEEPRSYLVQKGVKIYHRNRRDLRQSSDIDAQSQEPIVPPIPTTVPSISTPDPVIKTVSTPVPPVSSQEGGESKSKACKQVGDTTSFPMRCMIIIQCRLPGTCKLYLAVFGQNICMFIIALTIPKLHR